MLQKKVCKEWFFLKKLFWLTGMRSQMTPEGCRETTCVHFTGRTILIQRPSCPPQGLRPSPTSARSWSSCGVSCVASQINPSSRNISTHVIMHRKNQKDLYVSLRSTSPTTNLTRKYWPCLRTSESITLTTTKLRAWLVRCGVVQVNW